MSSLASKIASASTKVGALATDKVNAAQNYPYISADKILQRAGAALSEVGVIIFPSITGEAVKETTYTDNYGKSKTRHDATVSFTMLVSDGETELNSTWVGRGSDYSVPEKALYKAITSGHKYFLAKLLNIGVGNEDGEHEPAQEQTQTQPVQPKPTNGKPAQPVQPVKVVGLLTEAQRKRLHQVGQWMYADQWEAKRHELVAHYDHESSKQLTQVQAKELIDGIVTKLGQRYVAELYKFVKDPEAQAALAQTFSQGRTSVPGALTVDELRMALGSLSDDPFDDADAETEAAVAEARAEV